MQSFFEDLRAKDFENRSPGLRHLTVTIRCEPILQHRQPSQAAGLRVSFQEPFGGHRAQALLAYRIPKDE